MHSCSPAICSAAHRPAAFSLPSVIDYCSFGNHSCDHECVSVLNGYHCRCNDGYRLLDNGKTCQGESQEAEVKQLADKRRVWRHEESLPQNTAAAKSSRLSWLQFYRTTAAAMQESWVSVKSKKHRHQKPQVRFRKTLNAINLVNK